MSPTLLLHPVQLFRRFANSIAYLPTLAAASYGLLGLLILVSTTRDAGFPDGLEAWIPPLPDGARGLLIALLGGMISLMVFSFSMVMSILSQAGGNFSHKLVFGLIGERRHQWVLGHYLGTILLLLLLLMAPDDARGWMAPAVYLACLLVVHCLGLFVYFIHGASQSVQIDAVIGGLHDATLAAMHRQQARQRGESWRFLDERPRPHTPCHEIAMGQEGYVQGADLAALALLARRQDGRLHLSFRFGDYLAQGAPLAILEADEPPDAAWEEALHECLVRLDGESVSEHYVHGMTQLMEVAIKALSPGINDPGTARLCLHRLTDLLRHHLAWQPANALLDAEERLRVTWPLERFDSLLHRLFVPLLHYGGDDQSVLLGLLKALKALSLETQGDALSALQAMAERVVERLDRLSCHPMDRAFVSDRLTRGRHRLALPGELPPDGEAAQ
ncbi:DUF2254 domain-containing protein [Halomonas organivorans]|uniref:Putative membrane protein n=1 Tax=Halomonas organivorans TaxID=257772 RepID=A0A7W5G627_9GAMM|nr:DUF2254 family protein [Halomonas organivorans]MBB3142113.1 putative membrane protein [Halomonas organivorans]